MSQFTYAILKWLKSSERKLSLWYNLVKNMGCPKLRHLEILKKASMCSCLMAWNASDSEEVFFFPSCSLLSFVSIFSMIFCWKTSVYHSEIQIFQWQMCKKENTIILISLIWQWCIKRRKYIRLSSWRENQALLFHCLWWNPK